MAVDGVSHLAFSFRQIDSSEFSGDIVSETSFVSILIKSTVLDFNLSIMGCKQLDSIKSSESINQM